MITLAEMDQIAASPSTGYMKIGLRNSILLPAAIGGRLHYGCYYYSSRLIPYKGIEIFCPGQAIYFLASDPRVRREVDRGALRPRCKEGEGLGRFKLPEGIGPRGYKAIRQSLYQDGDLLIRDFINKDRPSPDEESAARFRENFNKIAEFPLLQYYHNLAREFMDWVRWMPAGPGTSACSPVK